MRRLGLFLLTLLCALPALASTGREATLCGFLKERLVFQIWSANTPAPNPQRFAAHPAIERVEFETGDGKILRGYRYAVRDSHLETVQPEGYLLVALGNAMIADQMIAEMGDYAESGYDVYVFNYRGYGDSEGKRRLGAIIKDYEEIVTSLNQEYERTLLYGISFGGIIMMNVLGSGIAFDAAVIDSGPSRLSDRGCPPRVDPVEHVSRGYGDRLLVITGDADTVLGAEMTGELRRVAARAGAKTYRGESFGHPFMDEPAVHNRRMKLIRTHLLENTRP